MPPSARGGNETNEACVIRLNRPAPSGAAARRAVRAGPRTVPIIADTSGMMVSDTTSDAISENDTVRAWSRNSCAAIPSMNTTGTKTAIVVRVDATTARPTSDAPRSAATAPDSPRSRRLKIASRTTIESSTSMPTPSASPPRDITFSVVPVWYIRKKVAMIEIGIDTPMMRVLKRSFRNSRMIRIERAPPSSALMITSLIESWMKRDWSTPVVTRMPAGISFWTRSSFCCTARATPTVLASPSL